MMMMTMTMRRARTAAQHTQLDAPTYYPTGALLNVRGYGATGVSKLRRTGQLRDLQRRGGMQEL